MIPLDGAGRRDRIARIERMIEHYREAKKRRLVRQAMTLWRQVEAQEKLRGFEKPPERVH
jgi:hypothetical protein